MPTHLYCLLPAGAEVAPPDGVRAIDAGGIVAWVADTDVDRLPRDRKAASLAAIDHDRVIGSSLHRGVTPVPATLTDPYASDADAVDDVAGRTGEILADLVRGAGMVEMTVIITPGTMRPDAADAVDSGRGRAYLERLRDLPTRLGTVADIVDVRVAAIASAKSRRPDQSRVAVSHLVMRGDVNAYREAVLSSVSDEYRLLIDGPRAPYSFFSFSPNTESGQGVAGRNETGKLNRDKKT